MGWCGVHFSVGDGPNGKCRWCNRRLER
jgi:hypothetical protein